jgi:hypothetical protein
MLIKSYMQIKESVSKLTAPTGTMMISHGYNTKRALGPPFNILCIIPELKPRRFLILLAKRLNVTSSFSSYETEKLYLPFNYPILIARKQFTASLWGIRHERQNAVL